MNLNSASRCDGLMSARRRCEAVRTAQASCSRLAEALDIGTAILTPGPRPVLPARRLATSTVRAALADGLQQPPSFSIALGSSVPPATGTSNNGLGSHTAPSGCRVRPAKIGSTHVAPTQQFCLEQVPLCHSAILRLETADTIDAAKMPTTEGCASSMPNSFSFYSKPKSIHAATPRTDSPLKTHRESQRTRVENCFYLTEDNNKALSPNKSHQNAVPGATQRLP